MSLPRERSDGEGFTLTAYMQGPFETEVDPKVPGGFLRVKDPVVFVRGREVVVLGNPDEGTDGDRHSCGDMGCGTGIHVVMRAEVRRW